MFLFKRGLSWLINTFFFLICKGNQKNDYYGKVKKQLLTKYFSLRFILDINDEINIFSLDLTFRSLSISSTWQQLNHPHVMSKDEQYFRLKTEQLSLNFKNKLKFATVECIFKHSMHFNLNL